MRLLSWTPIAVGAAELARRQTRYDRLSPSQVQIVLHDLGTVDPTAPRALESEADVRASEEAVVAAYRASDPQGFDAFLPDCVLDPAITSDGLALPMLGLSRLVSTFLGQGGASIGALARNRAIADELDRRLASYGVRAEPTVVMHLGVEDIADDEAWRRAVTAYSDQLSCDFALNACSAVELGEPVATAQVVDPTALALRLLGVRAELTGRGA